MEDSDLHLGQKTAKELGELLAHQIVAARECLCIGRIAIFAVDGDSASLVLAASSLDADSPEARELRLPLGFPPAGLLGECVIYAEEKGIPDTQEVANPYEAPVLRSLGRSVHLIPLARSVSPRCWEELNCGQLECPACGNPEPRCWLVSGTVCRDGRSREPEEKLGWCLCCPAFGVVGAIAMGVPDERDTRQGVERATLCHFTSNVAATIEAAQSTKALLQLNAELERRIAGATKELEREHQRAVRSEKLAATGRLVAGVAHQANNPLAVISTCVQSLRMGGSDAAATERNLEIMATEVQRLSRLVRNLLEFARDQQLTVGEADLGELLRQCVQMVAPMAGRSGVAVHVGEADGFSASVDRALIQQVLVNLLANAIQAAPRGGRVEATVRHGGTGWVDIVVHDNGTGMDGEVLAKAFDPFFTTRSRSGGIGLGLSLSLSIVERHGGTILVESAPGEGSAFTVRLPASGGGA